MVNFKKANELKSFLDQQVERFNRTDFIKNDPISIPHLFTAKEDIEISGFITALISWGRRPNIVATARKLMQQMDNSPFDFVMNAIGKEQKQLATFVYRTFQADDLLFLLEVLKYLYGKEMGLEGVVNGYYQKSHSVKEAIVGLREVLLSYAHLKRSEKHFANPDRGSAAKRINMFFRWMVRTDDKGVDFGLWRSIDPKNLMMPLDVHSGTAARKLGLLQRKQNDWRAVEELTRNLRGFDATDPVKYDFALFGLGLSSFKINEL